MLVRLLWSNIKNCEFWVFHLTTLFPRGPAEEILQFQLNLDRVTIIRRSIDSAICCVQSFVRDPLFTQRDFFTDYGISIMLSAVDVAGSVCEDSVYDPWTVILAEGYAVVVADLKRAYDVVLVRRKDARDTSERWFGVASVESSVVGESSGQQAVRISNGVEVGQVENLPQSVSTMQCPVRVSVPKAPERVNRRIARRPPNLQSSAALSLTMSWWYCPRDVESILMTPISHLL